MIEKNRFGAMVVDGKFYTADLKIFPDGTVVSGWRRAEGHRLCIEDLQDLIAEEPQVIVIGTGVFGRMKVAPALAEFLGTQKIELVAQRTGRAAETFNRHRDTGRKIAAGFHLTC
jgi:hypothetical protein